MDKYYRTYQYRFKEIVVAFFSVVLSLAVCSMIFGSKILKIDLQLLTYSTSEYNYIYILNYPAQLEGEYIYPDSSIMLYSSEGQSDRIAAVVLMQEKRDYDEEFINCGNGLKKNEISVSRNVAENYDMKVGDTVYAAYPNVSDLVELSVISIMDFNYDFENPDIDNDIGIVVVGYDENYCENTLNKAICFSKNSISADISDHPQLLERIINKDSNFRSVFKQGVHVFVFELIFVIGALIISEVIFFSGSTPRLQRTFLKGKSHNKLILIPLFEHFLFSVMPASTTVVIILAFIQINSIYTAVYYCLYIALILVFSVIVILHRYRSARFLMR